MYAGLPFSLYLLGVEGYVMSVGCQLLHAL